MKRQHAKAPSHFHADTPTGAEGDMLDRGPLAQALADLVRSYTTDKPLFIGVTGEWGAGKTSFLKMLDAQLSEHPYLAVRWLKPWLHGDFNDVLESMVATISEALNTEDGIGAEGVGALRRFGAALLRASSLSVGIPGFGTARIDLDKIASELAKREGEQLSKLQAIACEYIRNSKKRVVLLVDDCDRLEPTEIRQLLRLLRTALDFPGVVFVIGSDERVLRSAVRTTIPGVEDADGLSKFIQVVVPLPKPTPDQMRQIVLRHSEQLLASLAHRGVELTKGEEEELNTDVDRFLVDMLQTPRDVVRWANSCMLPAVHLHGEINRSDLCLLYALKLAAPSAFDYLWANRGKYFAILGEGSSLDLVEESIDKEKEGFIAGFGKAESRWRTNPERLLHRLLSRSLQRNQADELTKGKRLGSPEYFSVGFALSVGVAGISDRKVEHLLELARSGARQDALHFGSEIVSKDNWFSLTRSITRVAENAESTEQLALCDLLLGLFNVIAELSVNKPEVRNSIFRAVRDVISVWNASPDQRRWIAKVLVSPHLDYFSRMIFGFDLGRFFDENSKPVWAAWVKSTECRDAIRSVTEECRAELQALSGKEWDWNTLPLYLVWVAEHDDRDAATEFVLGWISSGQMAVGELLFGFGSWWTSSSSPSQYRLFKSKYYDVMAETIDPAAIATLIGDLPNFDECLSGAHAAEREARSQTHEEMMAVFLEAHELRR